MTFKKLTPIAVALSVLIATLIPQNTAEAAEVSGGDIANNGVMLLSDDSEISPLSVFELPFSYYIEGAYFLPSYTTDIINANGFGMSNNWGFTMASNHIYQLTGTFENVDYTDTSFAGNMDINYYVLINGVEYHVPNGWFNITVQGVQTDHISFGSYVTINAFNPSEIDNNYAFRIDVSGSFRIVDLGLAYPSIIDQMAYEGEQIRLKMQSWAEFLEYRLVEIQNIIADNFTLLKQQMTSWQESLEYRLIEIQSSVYNRIGDLMGLVQELRNDLVTHFDTLFSKMDEEHDEITNGYDDSSGTETNNKLNDSLTQIDDSQASIVEDGVSSLDDYTIPDQGIISYGTAFTAAFGFVATFMQAIFESAGNLTIITSVSCTLLIVAMIVGLYKFYKG